MKTTSWPSKIPVLASVSLLLVQWISGPAMACMNIAQEPRRPDTVLTLDRAEDIFTGAHGLIHLQEGQSLTMRFPMERLHNKKARHKKDLRKKRKEKWEVSIAGPTEGASISLAADKPAVDSDGVRRQTVVMKGVIKGDTIVRVKHDSGIKDGIEMQLLQVTVEGLESAVAPIVPAPLELGLSDIGKSNHVTYGRDIVVTLPLPDGEQGEWRLAESTGGHPEQRPDIIKSTEALGDNVLPATRFLVNSMAFSAHLDFEFIRTPDGNPVVDLFRSCIAQKVSFDIAVYPAPLC
jgi:hypothetical protein